MRKDLMLFVVSFLLLGIGLAESPSPPQVYYGYVTVNDLPAQDGLLIEAKISGILINSTVTNTGKYGYNPGFWIDYSSTYVGKVVKFYLAGVYVNQTVYQLGVPVRVNLATTTTCGNQVCEIGETSSNCCDDCGCESGYTCESNACVADTITPSCGDGTCNGDETCSTCSADCGCCLPECQLDGECDDGDDCTTDSCVTSDECTGECTYTAIESCEVTGDICSRGESKCEENKMYLCEPNPFGTWEWDIGQDCDEGCCDNICCGYEGNGLIGIPETTSLDLTGGITGFFAGVPGGIYLPVGLVALFALIAVFFLFYKKK